MDSKDIYTYRISFKALEDEENMNKVEESIKLGKADHIAIAFEFNRDKSYIPLEELRRRIENVKPQIDRIRELGFKIDINVGITLGHGDNGDDGPEKLYGVKFQNFIGHDGSIARSSFCFLDKNYRNYILEKYRLFALLNPDIIWIDDDLRLVWHWPVIYGCFCELHMEKFNKTFGTSFTRETLLKEFLKETFPEPNDIRIKWIDLSGELLLEFLKEITEAVYKVSPNTKMGLMNCMIFVNSWSGLELEKTLNVLSTPKEPAVIRPGALQYTDEYLYGYLFKANSIATLNSCLDRKYQSYSEIENYTHSSFEKSNTSLRLETLLYILIGGCNGHTFNLADYFGNPWRDYRSKFETLGNIKPYLETVLNAIKNKRQKGIKEIISEKYAKYCNIKREARENISSPREIWSNMLSINGIARGFEDKPPYLISGDNILCLEKEEILKILSSSVFLDWKAAYNLQEMGYGGEKYLGVKLIDKNIEGANEKFTKHDFNREYKDTWYFSRENTKIIEILSHKVEVITEICSINEPDRFYPGICLYENELKGRIAILPQSLDEDGNFGKPHYFNNRLFNFVGRRVQLRNILEWLCRGAIPCYVDSPEGFVAVSCWENEKECVIGLFNLSLDTQNRCKVYIESDATHYRLLEILPDGSIVESNSKFLLKREDRYLTVEVESLYPISEKILIIQYAS